MVLFAVFIRLLFRLFRHARQSHVQSGTTTLLHVMPFDCLLGNLMAIIHRLLVQCVNFLFFPRDPRVFRCLSCLLGGVEIFRILLRLLVVNFSNLRHARVLSTRRGMEFFLLRTLFGRLGEVLRFLSLFGSSFGGKTM